MTINGYLEDDELILYAMHALPDSEATVVARQLSTSESLRRRYADLQVTLGMYAEALADKVEVPAGSLNRLMSALPKQSANVVAMPARTAKKDTKREQKSAVWPVLGWAGWAIAASALVTVGVQYRHRVAAEQLLTVQTAQLQQKAATAEDLARERDVLERNLQEVEQQKNVSQAQLSNYKDQSATLSAQTAALSAKSAALSAKVAAESTRAQREINRANDLATVAAANARERDLLRGTVASQQDQVAQLSAQAANARQVLDALSDPTALRVSLTVPKQKKTPLGRGTYVPNKGTLLFTANNLPQLRSGKVYELWLMPTDGSSPIPAGTFVPDAQGNATLVSTNFQRSIAAKGFAVTAEPTGGSQKPTLPILLATS